MNYVELYPGDYMRDTADLSLVEHGAYLLLLLHYYSTERPLPNDNRSVLRIARAMSDDEQSAVLAVAERFFPVSEIDGLRRNGRADAEIVKAIERIEKNRENGKKGGRPKKPKQNPTVNPTVNPNETQGVTQTVTQTKAHHTPHANKEKEPKGSSASASADARETASNAIPCQAIADAYNATLTNLPRVRELTPKRRTLIRSAWQASRERQSMEFWGAYFAECQDDPFLNGSGPYRPPHENWRPNFDYLLKADVVTKVFEAAMDRMERES